MHIKVKMTRNGNSWAVRLPRDLLELTGFKQGGELIMEAKPGRLILRPTGRPYPDNDYDEAKQDARAAWNEAFDHAWLLTIGEDDEELVGAIEGMV